jgi:sucrose-6-phosphate hydrolase SacC (GH32 family)
VATFSLDEAAAITITIAGENEEAAPIVISASREQLVVAGAEAPLEPVDKSLTLHLFLDKSVLELFANNGRTVVTRVVDFPGEQAQIRIRAEGGSAKLTRLDGWQIKPIW